MPLPGRIMLIPPPLETGAIAASRSRVLPFQLFRPRTLGDTCELLSEWPDAVFHAGGIDVVNRMKAGHSARIVIALGEVAELKGVRQTPDSIEVGAATSHWQIEHDKLLRDELPCVPDYVSGLGNVRVRTQGTIGGNVMAGEPGYEMLALLAALEARLHFVGRSNGQRYSVAARGFRPDTRKELDLLTVVAIPKRASAAWSRDLRPLLGVVGSLQIEGNAVSSLFGAVTGLGFMENSIHFEELVSSHELASRSRSLADSWTAGLPLVEIPGGHGLGYSRDVLAVLMGRLLVKMAADPL
jgi:hypothetical protein